MELTFEFSYHALVLSEPGKSYAEVDLSRIPEKSNEVLQIWNLVDPMGNHHVVRKISFMMSNYLTISDVRRFYGLMGYNWFTLKYMGSSVFQLRIYDEFACEIQYRGGYHLFNPEDFLNYNEIEDSPNFKCTLSGHKMSGSQLNLPGKAAQYILNSGEKTWTLRGPTGIRVTCKVLDREREWGRAKLGSGWKLFCKEHDLNEGDQLLFMFSGMEDNSCDVQIIRALFY